MVVYFSILIASNDLGPDLNAVIFGACTRKNGEFGGCLLYTSEEVWQQLTPGRTQEWHKQQRNKRTLPVSYTHLS